MHKNDDLRRTIKFVWMVHHINLQIWRRQEGNEREFANVCRDHILRSWASETKRERWIGSILGGRSLTVRFGIVNRWSISLFRLFLLVIVTSVHDQAVLGAIAPVAYRAPVLLRLRVMQVFHVTAQRDLVAQDLPTNFAIFAESACVEIVGRFTYGYRENKRVLVDWFACGTV